MEKVVIDISISLDGFITGPNDNPKQENAEVLHNWLFSGGQVSQVNDFLSYPK